MPCFERSATRHQGRSFNIRIRFAVVKAITLSCSIARNTARISSCVNRSHGLTVADIKQVVTLRFALSARSLR